MFERLHLEERRRKEKEAALAATTKTKDLEECTFAPSVGARESAPTERDALPVHERLLQDAARHKEKMLQLEASQAKLMMEQTPFSPLIPESSRRLVGDSEDRSIFERLAQRKPSVSDSTSIPSKQGILSERSLYRSKSTGRERSASNASVVQDEPAVLKKKPLTPEEQEALYGRLTDRAKSAAEKLRELRSDPDAGRESTVSPLLTSRLGSFSDRSLSRLKNRSAAAEADKPSVLTKPALTPEEQEALYNRLNERARSASEKLRELREHPEILAETAAAAVRSSSYASFEDRSLFRSKSVGRSPNPAAHVTSRPESKPLSAEEQDALYARLIERAREASVKLKDVRTSVPREGASYNVEVPAAAAVRAIDPEKQVFYDRLATPKKPVETELVFSSVPDRSLTNLRDSSVGKGASAKERPRSFIPVRSGSIRVPQSVTEPKLCSGDRESEPSPKVALETVVSLAQDVLSPAAESEQTNDIDIIFATDSPEAAKVDTTSLSRVEVAVVSDALEPQKNFAPEEDIILEPQDSDVGDLEVSFSSPEKTVPPEDHPVENSAIKPMTPFSPATGLSVDVESIPSATLVVSDTGEVTLSPKSALLKAGLKSTPGGVFY